MSVALTSAPPALSFSGDRIVAEFTCTDIFSQVGIKAVNQIYIPDPVPAGHSFTLKWGGKSVTMVAAYSPDSSGNNFAATNGQVALPVEFQISYFQSNYKLSQDFTISTDGVYIIFTAKSPGTTFNMSIYNTTVGAIETLRPNYGIQVRLFCENAANTGFELINESFVNVQIGATNIAEFPIGDKLHTYISDEIRKNLPDIPSDSLLCKKSCRRYYFEYAEAYNDQYRRVSQSGIKTVLHGGFSALGQATKTLSSEIFPSPGIAKFLKQGPREINTRTDQPQYLYFFNTRPTVQASLKIKFYFTDGTVASISKYGGEIQESRKIGYNITFDKIFDPSDYPVLKVKKYEIWLEDADLNKASESIFYTLDYKYREFSKYFLNWSSWGTMDSRMFYGKGSHELELVQSKAERGYFKPNDINKGSALVYNNSSTTAFTSTTGFLASKTELLSNRDFYLSPLKYRVRKDILLPIEVTSKTIPEIQDGNNLYAQKFEWRYLFEDHAYTDGDVIPFTPIEIFVPGLIYFGPVESIPAQQADIIALGNSLPAETYGFPFYTGLNKILVIALPPGKKLGSVYDQDSEEDLAPLFVKKQIDVSNQDYSVFVMENTIAFTVSHTLLISIINV